MSGETAGRAGGGPGRTSGGEIVKLGDARFFRAAGPLPLAAIARAAGAAEPELVRLFSGAAPLQSATPDEVSFLDNRRYADQLKATRAGAVLVHPDMAGLVPEGTIAIVTPEPYVGWARVTALFHPPQAVAPGIHPAALVEPGAEVDAGAEIGAFAVIGAGARIGAGTRIGTHVAIGAGVVIGRDCRIAAHATISHALIGDRVTIHPGARIGQDGFGFAITKTGFISVPQLGRVVIEDDVDIGANTTIDRGSAQDTVIGRGARLDNLVMIAHNVRVGAWSVVVAQAGISGSTVIGKGVMIAGQAGLIGHLTIGDGARIGAQAGVMADVGAGEEVLGSPAQPARRFFREVAALRRLARRKSEGGVPPGGGAPPGDEK